MQILEKHLTGTWRSLKVFCFSGKVEQHTTAHYTELIIDQQHILCLTSSQNRHKAVSLQSDQWSIQETKKRWYLYIGKKQSFELITVEPDNLVLMDIVKGEKTFFTRIPEWYQQIETVVTSVRHVRPGAETKKA